MEQGLFTAETPYCADFTSEGTIFPIDHCTKEAEGSFSLFCTESGPCSRVTFDADGVVTGVVSYGEERRTGGSLVLSLARKEAAVLCPVGERILFVQNGRRTDWQTGVLRSLYSGAQLNVTTAPYCTVLSPAFTLAGMVQRREPGADYSIRLSHRRDDWEEQQLLPVLPDGSFSAAVTLHPGANFLECQLVENGQMIPLEKESCAIFYKTAARQSSEKLLWMEPFSNRSVLGTIPALKEMTQRAKRAGITALILDVRTVEGYRAYRRGTLSGLPYLTETKNPKKKFAWQGDLLEQVLSAAHQQDLRVYASVNLFVAGNRRVRDYGMSLKGKDGSIAQVLYAPEDKGVRHSVMDSKRDTVLCYLDPASLEVQQQAIRQVEEILTEYPVDGLIVDRMRYDSLFGGFSDRSRDRFAAFLQQKGTQIGQWPEDVYSIDDKGVLTRGPLFEEFLTYRSHLIHDFLLQLRKKVDRIAAQQKRSIPLGAYVEGRYELHPYTGINWASGDFIGDEALRLPAILKDSSYAATAFGDHLDFLLIGCYFHKEEQLREAVTIGNIVTKGKVPLIASLSLPVGSEPGALEASAKLCEAGADGLMFFELCYADWDRLEALNQELSLGKTTL